MLVRPAAAEHRRPPHARGVAGPHLSWSRQSRLAQFAWRSRPYALL